MDITMSQNQQSARPKIAAICTEVRKYAHAQHFLDRFLEGYGWDNRHHRPPFDLVSLYVDQVPEGAAPSRLLRQFRKG